MNINGQQSGVSASMNEIIHIGSLHQFCPSELDRFGYEKVWHTEIPSGEERIDKNVIYSNLPSDQLVKRIKDLYPEYFPLPGPSVAQGIMDVDNNLWAIVGFTGGAYYFPLH